MNDILSIILSLVAAAAAGLVGSFALMKRMTLAGDAMSHIALPGLGLAILFGINPIVGGTATLIVGSILIWKLEQRTGLSTETMIGVIFSASLAIGALITPEGDLIDNLFGKMQSLPSSVVLTYTAIAALIIFFLIRYRNQLILGLFSPDLARSAGVNLNRVNLYFLIVFSLSIVLGLRLLGALLVGSLIIIPAAIGRQLTHRFSSFLMVSSIVSVVSVGAGLLLAQRYGLHSPGPAIIVVATTIFILSLFKRKS